MTRFRVRPLTDNRACHAIRVEARCEYENGLFPSLLQMAVLLRFLLAVTTLLVANVTYAQALGVAMMHGEWGTPPPWHLVVSNAIEHEGWPFSEASFLPIECDKKNDG